MKIKLLAGLVTLVAFNMTALADNITYRDHIKPLWESQCAACHGANSPYLGDFEENEEKYVTKNIGPRMDTYADLLMYIAWPDTGALMRRLDDGKMTKDGKPGNMYVYLGASDKERQQNFELFKSWIGENAWTHKRAKAITKEELMAIKAEY